MTELDQVLINIRRKVLLREPLDIPKKMQNKYHVYVDVETAKIVIRKKTTN